MTVNVQISILIVSVITLKISNQDFWDVVRKNVNKKLFNIRKTEILLESLKLFLDYDTKKNIGIINYGVGNHSSVINTVKSLGHLVTLSSKNFELDKCEILLLQV